MDHKKYSMPKMDPYIDTDLEHNIVDDILKTKPASSSSSFEKKSKKIPEKLETNTFVSFPYKRDIRELYTLMTTYLFNKKESTEKKLKIMQEIEGIFFEIMTEYENKSIPLLENNFIILLSKYTFENVETYEQAIVLLEFLLNISKNYQEFKFINWSLEHKSYDKRIIAQFLYYFPLDLKSNLDIRELLSNIHFTDFKDTKDFYYPLTVSLDNCKTTDIVNLLLTSVDNVGVLKLFPWILQKTEVQLVPPFVDSIDAIFSDFLQNSYYLYLRLRNKYVKIGKKNPENVLQSTNFLTREGLALIKPYIGKKTRNVLYSYQHAEEDREVIEEVLGLDEVQVIDIPKISRFELFGTQFAYLESTKKVYVKNTKGLYIYIGEMLESGNIKFHEYNPIHLEFQFYYSSLKYFEGEIQTVTTIGKNEYCYFRDLHLIFQANTNCNSTYKMIGIKEGDVIHGLRFESDETLNLKTQKSKQQLLFYPAINYEKCVDNIENIILRSKKILVGTDVFYIYSNYVFYKRVHWSVVGRINPQKEIKLYPYTEQFFQKKGVISSSQGLEELEKMLEKNGQENILQEENEKSTMEISEETSQKNVRKIKNKNIDIPNNSDFLSILEEFAIEFKTCSILDKKFKEYILESFFKKCMKDELFRCILGTYIVKTCSSQVLDILLFLYTENKIPKDEILLICIMFFTLPLSESWIEKNIGKIDWFKPRYDLDVVLEGLKTSLAFQLSMNANNYLYIERLFGKATKELANDIHQNLVKCSTFSPILYTTLFAKNHIDFLDEYLGTSFLSSKGDKVPFSKIIEEIDISSKHYKNLEYKNLKVSTLFKESFYLFNNKIYALNNYNDFELLGSLDVSGHYVNLLENKQERKLEYMFRYSIPVFMKEGTRMTLLDELHRLQETIKSRESRYSRNNTKEIVNSEVEEEEQDEDANVVQYKGKTYYVLHTSKDVLEEESGEFVPVGKLISKEPLSISFYNEKKPETPPSQNSNTNSVPIIEYGGKEYILVSTNKLYEMIEEDGVENYVFVGTLISREPVKIEFISKEKEQKEEEEDEDAEVIQYEGKTYYVLKNGDVLEQVDDDFDIVGTLESKTPIRIDFFKSTKKEEEEEEEAEIIDFKGKSFLLLPSTREVLEEVNDEYLIVGKLISRNPIKIKFIEESTESKENKFSSKKYVLGAGNQVLSRETNKLVGFWNSEIGTIRFIPNRAFKNVDDSCYIDSVLFALLYRDNPFIHKNILRLDVDELLQRLNISNEEVHDAIISNQAELQRLDQWLHDEEQSKNSTLVVQACRRFFKTVNLDKEGEQKHEKSLEKGMGDSAEFLYTLLKGFGIQTINKQFKGFLKGSSKIKKTGEYNELVPPIIAVEIKEKADNYFVQEFSDKTVISSERTLIPEEEQIIVTFKINKTIEAIKVYLKFFENLTRIKKTEKTDISRRLAILEKSVKSIKTYEELLEMMKLFESKITTSKEKVAVKDLFDRNEEYQRLEQEIILFRSKVSETFTEKIDKIKYSLSKDNTEADDNLIILHVDRSIQVGSKLEKSRDTFDIQPIIQVPKEGSKDFVELELQYIIKHTESPKHYTCYFRLQVDNVWYLYDDAKDKFKLVGDGSFEAVVEATERDCTMLFYSK